MAKIDRFNGNVQPFAADSLGTERTIFGDTSQSNTLDGNITTDFLRGWGIVGVNENPTKQDFNGLAFTLGQLISYLHQRGIPEWNTSQEFYEGSVVTTLNGIYRLKAGGNATINPDTDAGVNWELAPTREEIQDRVIRVTSIAAMQASTAPPGYVFILNLANRSGTFNVVSGDFSTELADDTFNAIYVGMSDDPTAATKVLKRSYDGDLSILWFGLVGNGAFDNSTRIQAAIDFANIDGSMLFVPAGKYLHNSQIFMKKEVCIRGEGDAFDETAGSVFHYTGTQDGWQYNNPINTSSPIHSTISGVTFYAPNLAANKGAFADTCSTMLHISNCSFIFNANGAGLILDQTEVSTFSKNHFFALGFGAGACIWLVNGPSRNAGADLFFTNRITIDNNQINPNSSGARGILDDGGLQHSIIDNNINGGSICIELQAGNGVHIARNEMEAFDTAGIRITRGSLDVASPLVSIEGSIFFSISAPSIDISASTCDALTVTNNEFNTSGSGALFLMAEPVATQLVVYNNYNRGNPSNQPFNNISLPASTSKSTPVLQGSAVAGSNSYNNRTLDFDRAGGIVHVSIEISLTTKDAAMSGDIIIRDLPFQSRDFGQMVSVMYVSGVTLSANSTLSGFIPAGTSIIKLFESVSGTTGGFIQSSAISSAFSVNISGSYLV